jgi:hypothetical protein
VLVFAVQFPTHAKMVERKEEETLIRRVKRKVWRFRCVPVASDAFSCSCLPGYTGLSCETAISNRKMIDGLLLRTTLLFSIQLSEQSCNVFERRHVRDLRTESSIRLSTFLSKSCSLVGASYRCVCPNGYSGQFCETPPCM